MKIEIKDGKIAIDVSELVYCMSAEDRREVAKHIVARSDVFKAVVDCLVTGYFFDENSDWWSLSFRETEELRLRLEPLMPHIARQAIKSLVEERNKAKADLERIEKWAWSMYHAWGGETWTRPEYPRYEPGVSATEAELDELAGPAVELPEEYQ